MEKDKVMGTIRIPHKNNHPYVGDNLTRYYHLPMIKHFFLRRLTMVLDFLNGRHFDSILEIGFGSGVLLPELSKRSTHLFGIDLHDHINEVKEMLIKEDTCTILTRGDILHLPYKDESFDCVMSIATLEHIRELTTAIFEIKRVLKKDGFAILGFPVAHKVSDLLLVLTGSRCVYQKRLRDIHPSDHEGILSEVKRQFGNIEVKKFPRHLPLGLSLYCSCMSRKIN
jgi:SAM-dependent methyltransferase